MNIELNAKINNENTYRMQLRETSCEVYTNQLSRYCSSAAASLYFHTARHIIPSVSNHITTATQTIYAVSAILIVFYSV